MALSTIIQSSTLAEPSRMYRAPTVRGKPPTSVDKEGGRYGAGIIRGAALVQRGEAIGHSEWVDVAMLRQVVEAVNSSEAGIKSRFAHPSESDDGIGKALGRWSDASLDGDTVRADLHLFETAHDTPDGDLAGYVLRLAQEDPNSFGSSIAFEVDEGEMARFQDAHMDKNGVFVSPDRDNENGYPHVRMSQLRAADLVDDPAATSGLFHRRDSLAVCASGLLDYAFGITNDRPTESFGIAPERVRDFAARWMRLHGFKLVPVRRIQQAIRSVELDDE